MRILACHLLVVVLLVNISSVTAELFVVRVGDGTSTLTSAATATFIDRFNNDGSLSASPPIALPTTVIGANKQLTNSGTATSEGAITLSSDGNYLMLAGYGANLGTADVAAAAGVDVPRVVGRITLSNATVNTSTALTDAYSQNNIRSAVTSNGTDVWTAGTDSGTGGGVRYTTLGASKSTFLANGSQAGTNLTSARVVDIINGQLYVSSGLAGKTGPNKIGNGMPTASPQNFNLLPGFPTSGTHSPNGFWFANDNTVYMADDGTFGNGGGIQKWTQIGGNWSLAYTLLNTGAATTATRGLAGVIVEGQTVLYATTTQTSNNKLISITDTGASATATELAAAGANRVFRGVELVGGLASPVFDVADFNHDAKVDGDDLLILKSNFGTGKTNVQGNATAANDFDVDGADVLLLQRHLVVPAIVAIPEPSTIGAAFIGLAALRRRRASLIVDRHPVGG